jgi:type VI secretion system protein VasI
MRKICVLFSILFFVSTFGCAQSSELTLSGIVSDLRTASAIKDPAKRLKAFDQIAEKYVSTKGTPNADVGKWTASESVNALDDSKRIIFGLVADSGTGTFGEPVRLVIRFQSGETEVYITWNAYLGDDVLVTSRVGKQSAETAKWTESSDSKASFYPNDPKELIRQLQDSDVYVAKVTPFNENPITAIFDIRGLKNISSKYADKLEW